eukprot:CAMPEP_0176500280 /NCGR_PEP_ID=MMETSP0200_2-20121128/13436_1 /TAXON_ID=947934 /ORGANISM="Chaetoceros sp., Strain GSL56" /LENGTH=535 /DNA_ID=CAMNT_0017898875 /DNA_START=38 /DNA_END=1645 /DNA_ORIENTATION=+
MTSEIIPPTNQPPTSQNLNVQKGITNECSMDVEESPSTKVDSLKNGSSSSSNPPNKSEQVTSTSTASHEKPMLDSEMTDATPKVTKEKVQDSVTLGGRIDKQAFALLTGLYEDVKLNTETVITVPLTTFPAILGRSQTTNNKHIFDLGNCKQLSRQHAVIFFADAYGGRLGRWDDTESDDIKTDDDWIYKLPKSKRELKWIKKKGSNVPKEGFYAIECLSKNKVYVDGNRVEQGDMAILYHGSTIKMLTYTLYFLLPEGVQNNPRVITVPNPVAGQDVEVDDTSTTGPPLKKVKKEKVDPDTIELPLPELIKEFLDAIDTDKFERKHSMMSTCILHYAVQDVSKDASIQNASKSEGGVPRSVIMDWISNNETYSKYVSALLTKVEIKSYQQNLSRALIKGGFTRLGTTGRHVKWILPEGIVTFDHGTNLDMDHGTNPDTDHGINPDTDQGPDTDKDITEQLETAEESSVEKEEAEKPSPPTHVDSEKDNVEKAAQEQLQIQENTQSIEKDESGDVPTPASNMEESSIMDHDKSAE